MSAGLSRGVSTAIAAPDHTDPARTQPIGLLLLYALAQAGGVIAYTPFLMFVLPVHVSVLAGTGDVRWLGYIVFAGGIAASGAGVLFGWLSDVTRQRRAWIASGLALSIVLQFATTRASDPLTLLGLITAWQVALNMMLVPLMAWGGDLVPDAQKGLLGGLLAFAPSLGAWSAVALAASGTALPALPQKMALIAVMTTAAVLPALLLIRSDFPPRRVADAASDAPALTTATIRMWIARLFIQISGVALASYLVFWLRSVDPAIGLGEMSVLYTVGLTAAILVSLALGRWSDRHDRAFAMLAVLAMLTAASLMAMGLAGSAAVAKAGYVLFAVASTSFLALHAGQTLRILPDPARRGRALGIFNLTNTAPSLIMPWLAILLVPVSGYGGLILILAALALIAAILVAIPRRI